MSMKKSKKEVVLELLKARPVGITSKEFFLIGIPRASTLISELRKEGYNIETTRMKDNPKNHVFRYLGEGLEVDNRTPYNKLAHVLYKKGYKEVAQNLEEILQEAEVVLRNVPRVPIQK